MRPSIEAANFTSGPRLLIELPPWIDVFFGNVRDLVSPRHLPPLELSSAPSAFWPDVFVQRSLPWNRFLQSGIYHLAAGAILIGLSHLLALQPRAVETVTFDRAQVIHYQAAEYLPPLDTRAQSSAPPAKADPELSRQPIISLPPEADNRSQTIVAPPKIKLKREITLPNVVAWSDQRKPQLAVPAAPLVPAADIRRLVPSVANSVVAPSPDAARMDHRSPTALQTSVVAPPPDVRASNARGAVEGLQPQLIAPPPTVETASARRLGDMNIAPSYVIAPAPQLPVAVQRAVPGGNAANGLAAQVVPPPPSLSASGSAGGSAGANGRMIALNLHPAVGGPPDPPPGNRRGSFAATPGGHSRASGTPGAVSGNAGAGAGSAGKKVSSDLPAGLYVGTLAAKPAAVASDSAAATTNTVNPNLIASVHPPRVSSPRPMQPESATKLSEAERSVFGNRKFYSVMVSSPNLNSASGSWVIRFAELKPEARGSDASPAADLSQPTATREVDPAYPLQLMRQNVSGTVVVYAVIHADGSVGNVRVLSGADERLDRFASEAVAQWKFEPATKNGAPVDVEATFRIPFRPTRVGTSF